jgi:hypothetical protein
MPDKVCPVLGFERLVVGVKEAKSSSMARYDFSAAAGWLGRMPDVSLALDAVRLILLAIELKNLCLK